MKIQDISKRNEKLNEIAGYISGFMDIYLFPRIFRSFRQIEGVYSEDAKNIIIYGGAFHTREYYNWLKELGFEKVYSASDKREFNCIEIKNFTPIFLS